jgi:hypothetical protein
VLAIRGILPYYYIEFQEVYRLRKENTMKILITLIFNLFFVLNTFADILNVPQNYSTIQEAIDASKYRDTVLVAEGTYLENINFKGKAITVASYFLIDGDTTHIDRTIIDGSQPSNPDSGSVVCFCSGEDTTSIISGFTITGGTGMTAVPGISKIGGGIACLNSGAKITNNCIKNNEVISSSINTVGGGIAAGPPGITTWIVIKNNDIRNNLAASTAMDNAGGGGGGIYVGINARICDNIIEHNIAQSTYTAIWGGGVKCGGNSSQPLIRYCFNNRIRFNKAVAPTSIDYDGGRGGGLAVTTVPKAIIKYNDISYNEIESNTTFNNDCWGGGVILQNQTEETIFAENWITHNKAINNSLCRGAGINIWNFDNPGKPRIIKNVIAHNTGGTQGGGFFIGGLVHNSAALVNNTIYDNHAIQGGAVYIGHDNYNVSHPKIENSILWANSSSIYINSGTIDVTYSDVEGGWSGTGNIDSDPLFADTLYHLTNGSPCIDTGNPDHAYNDEDGSRNDMGAYGGMNDPTGLYEHKNLFLPSKYSLYQNYPNPFNPSTMINYQLPVTSVVDLSIYNLLGQKVVTLVNKRQKPGYHQVEWDASGFASGVYYYTLHTSSGFFQTRKCIFLR